MRLRRCTTIIVALWAGGVLHAEGNPPPFADFTFKRVGVPSTGARRITVQIDPAQQEAARKAADTRATPDAGSSAPAAPTAWDWFWADISPKFAEEGRSNIYAALDLLSGRDGVPQPRLQHLQGIAQAHGTDILRATVGTRVSPALVLALISVESAGKTDALSGAGAQGLMQLIPDTAARFGVTDSTDPAQNIKGGVAYLSWLLEHFAGDPIMALAGYNAGENAVTENGGVPPYAETRAYVPKVLAAWQVARGLCLTPPELLTDGCVFAVKGANSNG